MWHKVANDVGIIKYKQHKWNKYGLKIPFFFYEILLKQFHYLRL